MKRGGSLARTTARLAHAAKEPESGKEPGKEPESGKEPGKEPEKFQGKGQDSA